ncbi:hypothetical protein [Mycobacterium xenopi]|uniref:hypothetical protein n=1 Tax=Mycobacterium xenopi TaxID=1789 RepID=UPI000A147ED0|nr:hypothetical protein [Mycobacterium xenopi]ORX11368.1 hypothetical protein AWC32_16770 [Mycobacterium xenopi]SPX94900.1 Uncharacterised protein [Mycobacterium xenopi]
MSIAPPPPAYPTWPPPPHPPAPPQRPRRGWVAVAAAAGVGAVVSGVITTLITVAATSNPGGTGAPATAPTVTVTAAPAKPPAPLPAAEADKQTCHAYGTVNRLATAATTAMSVIPEGMPFTDPAVQNNPAWKASVMRAGQLFGQAADTFASQIAPGTSPMLAGVADTTVSSLRALSVAYQTFDPDSDKTIDVWFADQKALDWLCSR